MMYLLVFAWFSFALHLSSLRKNVIKSRLLLLLHREVEYLDGIKPYKVGAMKKENTSKLFRKLNFFQEVTSLKNIKDDNNKRVFISSGNRHDNCFGVIFVLNHP